MEWRDVVHDDGKHRSCPNLKWPDRQCRKTGQRFGDVDGKCIATAQSGVVDVHADLSESGTEEHDQIVFLSGTSGSVGRGLPSDGNADLPESGKPVYEPEKQIGKLSGISGSGKGPDFGQHIGTGEKPDCG